MTTNDNINVVLHGLSTVEHKYDFIEDGDVSFLNEFFRRFESLILVKESLEENDSIVYDDPIDNETLETLTNLIRKSSKKNRDAGKLYHILKKVHFKAFFSCLKELNNEEHIPITYSGSLHEIELDIKENEDFHDGYSDSEEVDRSSFVSDESEIIEDVSIDNFNLPPYQDIRYNKGYADVSDFQIISVQREISQSLGITVVKTTVFHEGKSINRCTIERILVNSLIDKQGLMQVGDVIFEVNEKPIENPDQLQHVLSKCKGTITFKILKSSKRPISNSVNLDKVYMRALFDYDPAKDKLLPAEQIGLGFKAGDVFEVLNRDDPSFWQAVPLDSTDNQAFLIPSQSLQERIIALQNDLKPKSNENIAGKTKRKKSKKNEIFRAKDAADMVSGADLHTYEEVVKFSASRVPCVLLIGPSGVGKKAIKHLLVQKEPHRFSFPIQDTSEAKKSRNQPLFNHVDRNTMLGDIKASLYVCLEEKSGELYGIKSSAIRELINQGKTVVLDCQPKEVYKLKTPLLNPYVVLIAAPTITVLEAMQKEGLQKNLTKNKRSTVELQDIINQSEDFENMYKHLINLVIVNEDIHQSATYISSLLSDFENKPSWIPASWEFDIAPLPINKPLNNKGILKQNESSTITSTGGRRYEKRNEKPSVSLSSNRVPLGNQSENSFSEQESDSNSENNLVMAKPVKFLNAKKPDEITFKTEDKPIKTPKKLEDIVLKNEDKPLKHSNSKNDDKPIKHSNSKNDDKLIKHSNSKNDDKPLKHSNSKKPENNIPRKEDKSLKSTNSKKVEDVPLRKDERSVKHSNSRKSEDNTTKGKDKSIEIMTPNTQITNRSSQPLEITKPTNLVSKNPRAPATAPKPKVGNQNISVSASNNKNQIPEINHDESIKNNRPVSIQKPPAANVQPQKVDRRMKIVKKENSSSEISDTSSESDAGLKENRV